MLIFSKNRNQILSFFSGLMLIVSVCYQTVAFSQGSIQIAMQDATFGNARVARFNNDGQLVAINNDQDPEIHIWEVRTKKKLCSVKGDFPFVFTPDGEMLVYYYEEQYGGFGINVTGYIAFFELSSKKIVRKLPVQKYATEMIISEDGKYLAVGGAYYSKGIAIVDLQDYSMKRIPGTSHNFPLSYSYRNGKISLVFKDQLGMKRCEFEADTIAIERISDHPKIYCTEDLTISTTITNKGVAIVIDSIKNQVDTIISADRKPYAFVKYFDNDRYIFLQTNPFDDYKDDLTSYSSILFKGFNVYSDTVGILGETKYKMSSDSLTIFKSEITIWDREKRRTVHRIPLFGSPFQFITPFDFHPQKRLLVIPSENGITGLFKFGSDSLSNLTNIQITTPNDQNFSNQLYFTANNAILLSENNIWSVNNPLLNWKYDPENEVVGTGSDNLVAIASRVKNNVIILDLERNLIVDKIELSKQLNINKISLINQNRYLLLFESGKIHMYDLQNRNWLLSNEGYNGKDLIYSKQHTIVSWIDSVQTSLKIYDLSKDSLYSKISGKNIRSLFLSEQESFLGLLSDSYLHMIDLIKDRLDHRVVEKGFRLSVNEGKSISILVDSLGNIQVFNTTLDRLYLKFRICYPFSEFRLNETIALSSDGKWVAGIEFDGSFPLFLWKSSKNDSTILEKHYDTDDIIDPFLWSVSFSGHGRYIISSYLNGEARIWDTKDLRQINGITSISSIREDEKLAFGQLGEPGIIDLEKRKLILSYVESNQGSRFAFIDKEGSYYYTNKSLSRDGIAFKLDQKVFEFDQFDLRFNRPDLLYRVLGNLSSSLSDSSRIFRESLLQKAYKKRLKVYNLDEDVLYSNFHTPECNILNNDQLSIVTSKSRIQLEVAATDSLLQLDRINVYVNNVPIYGIPGINLREQSIQEYTTTLDIPLSRGENKIQVSAFNQGGAESLKATTYITYDAPEQKPDLYLITIGVSDYQSGDNDLKYAAKDARDIATFYQSSQAYNNIYFDTLIDFQATKGNILALRKKMDSTKVDDQVILHVSGHGLIDTNYNFYYATHDIDFANPSEKGILYDEIEGLLDGIPARKKLLLMDTCHSGEYDVDAPPLTVAQRDSLQQKGISFKGFSKGDGESGPTLGLQNSFEMMQLLFADLRRGSGATVITSSAGVQVSFEDEEWQNGAFTYAFLYGLKSMKADSNQDGQVTASEIQAFVAEYVPRLTEGLQVPTFRRENLEFDFRVW